MRHILGRLLNQKKLLCHLIKFSLQQQLHIEILNIRCLGNYLTKFGKSLNWFLRDYVRTGNLTGLWKGGLGFDVVCIKKNCWSKCNKIPTVVIFFASIYYYNVVMVFHQQFWKKYQEMAYNWVRISSNEHFGRLKWQGNFILWLPKFYPTQRHFLNI